VYGTNYRPNRRRNQKADEADFKINWSEFIRNAIKCKIEEERRRSLAKAILINERLRRKRRGEPKAEEIIRMFRKERWQ